MSARPDPVPASQTWPTQSYSLTVNGVAHDVVEGWVGESLLDVLRDRLDHPGAKNACEQGECGSCSVLVDGTLLCACLVLAVSVEGADITTIEALGAGGSLSLVQQAFVDAGAVQCGFCTPGLVMAVTDLLDRGAARRDTDPLLIREAVSGNLCRCTGYGRILDAIDLALARLDGDRVVEGGAPA